MAALGFFLYHPLAVFVTSWSFQFFSVASVTLALLFIRLQKTTSNGHLAIEIGSWLLFLGSLSLKPWSIVLSFYPAMVRKISKSLIVSTAVLLLIAGYSFYLTQRGINTFYTEKHMATVYDLSRGAEPRLPGQIPIFVEPGAGSGVERAVFRLTLVGNNVAFYIAKIILPVNLTLFYPRVLEFRAATFFALMLMVSLFILILGAVTHRGPVKSSDIHLVGLLLFAGLLPVSGIVYIPQMKFTPVSNHWAYFALPGFALLIAYFVKRLSLRRWAGGRLVPVVVTLMLLAVAAGGATYSYRFNRTRKTFIGENRATVPRSEMLEVLYEDARDH